MALESDKKLTALAAELWRDAAEVYDPVAGLNPVIAALSSGAISTDATGSFSALTGAFPTATGSFAAVTGALPTLTASFLAAGQNPDEPQMTLKRIFRLPAKLPGVRLLPEPELADMARSAPIMGGLNALARWLGRDGRLVTGNDQLTDDDAADASRQLGIGPVPLSFLWEYALISGWFELEDSKDGKRTWAVIGDTAWRWAAGDDRGVLHAWAVVFAAVATRTLGILADAYPDGARKLDFRGQGAALPVMLFLSRQSGMTTRDVEDLVRDSAIGERPSSRRKRAWTAWVQEHGEPAHRLLGELAAVRAVIPPASPRGSIKLTPLALWALRTQFVLEKISVRVLPPASPRMSGAELVALCDAVSEAEFDAICSAWLVGRDADQTTRELLMYAGSSAPRERLIAVDVARRIGVPGMHAWLDAMKRAELRGYARVTLGMLAAYLPETSLPLVLEPDPDDMAWLATDLLALACGADEPDPDEVAEQFAAAVPEGEEEWILGLMAQSSHPDVVRVLEVLGRYHPTRRIAKNARKAARTTADNRRMARGHHVSGGVAS